MARRRVQRWVRVLRLSARHIAQVRGAACIQACRAQSRLVALVSDDAAKRRIRQRYRIEQTFSYDETTPCLDSVDAVYIALPNSMHAEYAMRPRAPACTLCENRWRSPSANAWRWWTRAAVPREADGRVIGSISRRSTSASSISCARAHREPKFFNSSSP